MGRNQGKGIRRKPQPLAESKNQPVPPPPSSTVSSTRKTRFHIDWKQVNFPQFLVIFVLFLFLLLYVIIPILNEINWLRPHANAIAQIIGIALLALATVLSAGVIKVERVDIWQKPKLRQAVFAFAISALATLIILLSIIRVPSSPPTRPQLASVPYPPYHGVLALDGMQSKPSPRYYWEQRTDGGSSCKFVGSNYYVTTTKRDRLEICSAVNTDFHNFAFEIEMSFVKPGNAIIYFRLTTLEAYQLVIASLGNYAELSLDAISFPQKSQPSHIELIPQTPIFVNGEGVKFSPEYTNRIAVVAYNQTITLYVNGKTAQPWHVTDDTSSQGAIVLGAGAASDQAESQTIVAFSNTHVWTL